MTDWTEYVNDDVRTVAEALVTLHQWAIADEDGWRFRMSNAGKLVCYHETERDQVHVIAYEHFTEGQHGWTIMNEADGYPMYDTFTEAVHSIVDPLAKKMERDLLPGDR